MQEYKSGKVLETRQKRSLLQDLVTEIDDVVRIQSEPIAVLISSRDTKASILSSVCFILARRPDVAKLPAVIAKLASQ